MKKSGELSLEQLRLISANAKQLRCYRMVSYRVEL